MVTSHTLNTITATYEETLSGDESLKKLSIVGNELYQATDSLYEDLLTYEELVENSAKKLESYKKMKPELFNNPRFRQRQVKYLETLVKGSTKMKEASENDNTLVFEAVKIFMKAYNQIDENQVVDAKAAAKIPMLIWELHKTHKIE